MTISISAGLTPEQVRRATEELDLEFGDPGPGFPALMAQAGFEQVTSSDVTAEYRSTLQKLMDVWSADGEAIGEVMGRENYEERMTRRRKAIIGVGEGLHHRYWLTAVKS